MEKKNKRKNVVVLEASLKLKIGLGNGILVTRAILINNAYIRTFDAHKHVHILALSFWGKFTSLG